MEELLVEFYRGYESVKKIPQKYYDNILIYKLYRVITMLACQLNQPEDRQLKEVKEESMKLLKELLMLVGKDEKIEAE